MPKLFPEHRLEIAPGDIHLWITNPRPIHDADLLSRYAQLLTTEEKEKHQRYRFADRRHDALVTRAFLRDLLSQYVDMAPSDWRFCIGEKGKPEIIDPPLPLRFNLSHTAGLIICAVTLENAIGCDVENVMRESDFIAIAKHHFSQTELADLLALPRAEQRSRFFDYWTLKESYIKANGFGIFGVPLQDFSFSIDEQPSGAVNDRVSISFAGSVDDSATNWRSWLYYPNEHYRIALSLKTSPDHPFKSLESHLRLFHSIPLTAVSERPWGTHLALG